MRVAIIDGDILAYQACPPRDDFTGSTRVKQLNEDGYRVAPEMTETQKSAYFEEAWKNFEKTLSKLPDKLFCDDMLMALSGVPNFRQQLFPDYKTHRSKTKYSPNPAVPRIRERAVERGLGVQALGYEADDLLRIWANEAEAAGHEFVLVSYDKDLLCIPGMHYILHRDKPHELREVSKFEARKHYYAQLLQGDMTDNIPGIPGIGPKRAEKIIAGCITETDMQEAVASQYFDYYGPEEWMDYLLINAKLIHILGHPNDYFTGENWEILRS